MAGSIAISSIERSGCLGRMTILATASATGADPASTVISGPGLYSGRAGIGAIKGYLQYMDTNPGSTAPSANYDIVLTNSEGVDVLRGTGANRSKTDSQRVPTGGTNVGDSGLVSPVFPTDTLTLAVTSMTVNDSTTQIVLYWDEKVVSE